MVKRESLAAQIAGVLSSTPAQFNPDDDHVDDTAAKLTNFEDYSEEDDESEEFISKFRKQNIDFLDDVDKKYAGKKGSRKRLKNASSSDEQSGSDEVVSDEDINTQSGDEDIEQADADDSTDSENSESEDGDDNDDIDSEFEDNVGDFKHMNEENESQQVEKGQCVRNQITMWENLLEMRIQMQKCVLAGNKMPSLLYYKEMMEQSNDTEFKTKISETKDSICNVLDKLLTFQELVIKNFPETKNLDKQTNRENSHKEKEDDNEEIPSDTEDEENEGSNSSEDDAQQPQKKKRKLQDFEADISSWHEKYSNYRNKTIEKWNAKTRLSITKTSGQVHSVLNQIEHITSDKPKLRRRTQLKRSDYKILGEKTKEILESNEENGDIKQIEEYNPEIFDDSDFYHQLLRELIEVKSAGITDPIQLGKQWIQLQNMRSKMKRKIDTRATKGRKIRYTVHTKLVNFMAPFSEGSSWTDDAKNELYSSLFGKIKSVNR